MACSKLNWPAIVAILALCLMAYVIMSPKQEKKIDYWPSRNLNLR